MASSEKRKNSTGGGKPVTVPGWYNRLSRFFKERFGERVTKIPLDAGLTCPNRDGTLSREGCIFCHNPAFSPAVAQREHENQLVDVQKQIGHFQWRSENRSELPPGKTGPTRDFIPRKRYLAYFQSYSNTYGPLPLLERLYNEALQTPGMVGLSVATRPDCLEPEVLDLLTALAQRYHIWLELGLQSAHDRTLKLINRGHTFACFQEAVNACRGRGLYICVHLINGLPGEDPPAMLETAVQLATLPIHGVKFHQLQIMAGTSLEQLYRQGAVNPLSQTAYLDIICNQLEVLPAPIVVHRLMAETPRRDLLLAPDWHVQRAQFAGMVEEELRRRGTWQGGRG